MSCEQFACALAALLNDSVEERCGLVFHALDVHGNVTRDEVTAMAITIQRTLSAIVSADGISTASEDPQALSQSLRKSVEDAFQQYDTSGSGSLSLLELQSWLEGTPDVFDILFPYPSTLEEEVKVPEPLPSSPPSSEPFGSAAGSSVSSIMVGPASPLHGPSLPGASTSSEMGQSTPTHHEIPQDLDNVELSSVIPTPSTSASVEEVFQPGVALEEVGVTSAPLEKVFKCGVTSAPLVEVFQPAATSIPLEEVGVTSAPFMEVFQPGVATSDVLKESVVLNMEGLGRVSVEDETSTVSIPGVTHAAGGTLEEPPTQAPPLHTGVGPEVMPSGGSGGWSNAVQIDMESLVALKTAPIVSRQAEGEDVASGGWGGGWDLRGGGGGGGYAPHEPPSSSSSGAFTSIVMDTHGGQAGQPSSSAADSALAPSVDAVGRGTGGGEEELEARALPLGHTSSGPYPLPAGSPFVPLEGGEAPTHSHGASSDPAVGGVANHGAGVVPSQAEGAPGDVGGVPSPVVGRVPSHIEGVPSPSEGGTSNQTPSPTQHVEGGNPDLSIMTTPATPTVTSSTSGPPAGNEGGEKAERRYSFHFQNEPQPPDVNRTHKRVRSMSQPSMMHSEHVPDRTKEAMLTAWLPDPSVQRVLDEKSTSQPITCPGLVAKTLEVRVTVEVFVLVCVLFWAVCVCVCVCYMYTSLVHFKMY